MLQACFHLIWISRKSHQRQSKAESIMLSHDEENEISVVIVRACFNIHQNLGPGRSNLFYEEIPTCELEREFNSKDKLGCQLKYKDRRLEIGFRA